MLAITEMINDKNVSKISTSHPRRYRSGNKWIISHRWRYLCRLLSKVSPYFLKKPLAIYPDGVYNVNRKIYPMRVYKIKAEV